MNEPATTQVRRVASPLSTARTAGVLYLLNIATILVAVFLFRGIIVSGDPSASANNLVGHEARFRIAVAFELISTACSVAVAGLLYTLLKPVSRNLSLIAAFGVAASRISRSSSLTTSGISLEPSALLPS